MNRVAPPRGGRVRGALQGLTTRGRCLLAAGGTLLVSGVVLGQRDLVRAAVFLLALPLLAVGAVVRTRYRLACTRWLEPARVEAGAATSVRLRLDNVSRLPSGVLLMEDTLPYSLGGRPRFVLDRVEPQGVREVTYPLRSEVRGTFGVGPLSVRLTDPFGLCELARSFSSTSELVVTPVIQPLPAVRLGGDWTGGGETSARSISTSGTDDAATREYRHGDDLRKVHWRSTARVGELMVRREEQPAQSRATLLLDTRARAHRGEGPASSFEWSVSAAASIAAALSRGGFGLRLGSDRTDSLLPPGAPPSEGMLLEALARVVPSDGRDLSDVASRLRRTPSGGVLVAVLGALSAEDAERLARLRQGSAGCVAVLLDTATWAAGRTARGPAPASSDPDSAGRLLESAGWRVLRVAQGTALASVWPLAGGRGALARPAAAVSLQVPV